MVVVDEGNSARQVLGDPKAAAKCVVLGVVDYVEVEGELAYDHRERDPVRPR